MHQSSKQVLKLSAKKRELLKTLRQREGVGLGTTQTIPRRGPTQPLPLSFAQEWMWLLEKFASPVYNNPLTLQLSGRLNIAALEKSLTEIVRRHETLRTTFVEKDGRLSQILAPTAAVSLPIVEVVDSLNTTPLGSDPKSTAQRLVLEETRRPFNLAQDFSFRAILLRLSDTEYWLHLTLHHIVSDDASYAILLKEIETFYSAFSQGLSAPLPDLPIQYADYACWQRQTLRPEVLDSQLDYWRQKLRDRPPALELPSDRKRSLIKTNEGARHPLNLSKPLTQALKRFSQQQQVTLFTTLLAAFKTLLYRYTGQCDLIVGIPVSSRNRTELQGLIGVFINNLALRADLSGDPTFQDLLGRLSPAVLEARSYQDIPYVTLIKALQPEREQGSNPLLQILFDFQGTRLPNLELPHLTSRVFELDTQISKVDLTLHLAEEAEELGGYLEYSTDLFDATTIERMAGHFQTLLEGIVANPKQAISKLSILPAGERHQLLVEYNKTQTDYPSDHCFHQLFEAQVERTPDAIALVFENQHLTYRTLNQRTNQLAHYLQSLGVGPDILVGICVERSLDMLVGLLSILKAGGAYVPMDPAYPQERLGWMLEDSNVPVIVTQESLVSGIPTTEARVVCLDRDWHTIAEQSQQNLIVKTNQTENLAYVIFTSGSTGRPKGVQITHQTLVNFLSSMQQKPGLTQADIFLAVTTISFDIAALELYLPLTVGAQVVLVSREIAADGNRLSTALEDSGATVMQATPASWNLLLATGWRQKTPLKILCGGEALTPQLASELLARGASVWNLYGPTEATVWATCSEVKAAELVDSSNDAPVTIGRPIANTQIYILDAQLQPVPVGVPGELFIGGSGLALGYLNRPDLTAAKFIPDPFSRDSAARLYRTGDLARYLPDGKIEFFGRIDHQVKIRGFRIELGEIEAVLSQHSHVNQCVVIAREYAPGDKRLVAYVVLADRETPTINDFRQFLKQSLPEYMIPSIFVHLESLPLTPNGKINRRVLPPPDMADISSAATYIAPRSPLEKKLAQIWRQVLKLEQVSIHDNFFDLGGHSLLAVHLFADIKKAFDQDLPLTTIFQAPTIEELATLLHQSSESAPADCSLIPLQTKGSTLPLFLAPIAGSTVLNLGQLVRHLQPDQPVYGLEPLGMNGKQFPHTRLEEMAAYYIQEIQKIQSQGPYFLVGRCFGGLVVFEMAQQLWAQGEKVALLAILDTKTPPNYSSSQIDSQTLSSSKAQKSLGGYFHRMISRDYFQRLAILWRLGRLTPARFFQSRATALCLKTLNRVDKGNQVDLLLQKVLFSWIPRLFTLAAHRKARKDYWAKVYPGTITFFKNSDESMSSITARWAELTAAGLDCHTAPGDHRTMIMEPQHAKVVAEKLSACLNKIHGAGT